jgi:uncharacterized membrane protein
MPRRRRAKKNPDFKTSVKRRGKVPPTGNKARIRRRGSKRWQKATIERGARPHRSPLRNPAAIFAGVDWVETGKLVGVAFGGFAAGRLMTRIVSVQVAKRKPTWAKHAGVAANFVAFAAALFGAKRWSKTRPYETPLVLGTGLSLVQTILQTYFPKLGWMVSETTPEQIAEAAGQQQLPAAQTTGYLPDDDGVVGEDDWSDFNDAYDQGRFARSAQPGNQPPPPPRAPQPVSQPSGVHQEGGGIDDSDDVDDVLTDLSDDEGGGVFSPAN